MKYLLTFSLTIVLLSGCTSTTNTDQSNYPKPNNITTFEECAASGYEITTSFPNRCITPEGKTFIKNEIKTKVPANPNPSTPTQKICTDLCGDGLCQEIVCMGQGCPCPENTASCPKDCQKQNQPSTPALY
jgi:hypothetical protein